MNILAHDFPPEAFPIRVYAYPQDQKEDVNPAWHIHISEPCCLCIPGLSETGFPVRIVVTLADGSEARS